MRSDRSLTAENDATLDWLRDVPTPSRHAFWGTDPSGYCGCDDCEPTRAIPPGDGYGRALAYADDIADLMSDAPGGAA